MFIEDIPCRLHIARHEYGKFRQHRRLHRALCALNHGIRKPLIIYQMAKVGSSSVLRSLRECGLGTIHHLHFLLPENVSIFYPRIRHPEQEPFIQHMQKMHLQRLGDWQAYVGGCRELKVITMVRDPIARNFSLFFQHLGVFTGAQTSDLHCSTQELRDIFLYRFQHAIPLVWFDIELHQALGIDVYRHPFPKEQGHLRIQQGGVDLLILKAEIDDTIKVQAIRNFLGIRDFSMIQANVSQDKSYGMLYKQFVREVHLPESYIEAMCYSKYMNHFYTGAEMDRVRSKWIRTVSAGS
jgi:hypothetical protein